MYSKCWISINKSHNTNCIIFALFIKELFINWKYQMECLLGRNEFNIKYHHLDTFQFNRLVLWSVMIILFPRVFKWYILGINTNNFTTTKDLLMKNSRIKYLKFEVLYQFPTGISASSLHFIRNHSPIDGFCQITPFNGTTITLFTISCLNWSDQDGIKDYSLYCIECWGLLFPK